MEENTNIYFTIIKVICSNNVTYSIKILEIKP